MDFYCNIFTELKTTAIFYSAESIIHPEQWAAIASSGLRWFGALLICVLKMERVPFIHSLHL